MIRASDPRLLADIDDGWDVAGPLSNNHGPSEIDSKWQSDMGLSASDVADITSGFRWVADRVYAALLERGKIAWNQLLNNDPNCPVSATICFACALKIWPDFSVCLRRRVGTAHSHGCGRPRARPT